jgi:LmbE family N-acetylglucosaminyl deacetylase/GNAT superfamily N-acetyltransferase
VAKRAFAVAAHPDDIEFHMGGTLILLGNAGYELHYLNIANGSCGTTQYSREEIIRIRRAEAMAAAASIGATYHESLVDDLEIFYEKPLLARVTAVMREVAPEIVLTHSPTDYMEDHQNACRLAVTAAFCRGMPNFPTDPPMAPVPGEVTVYHAQPHGNVDPLRQPVQPDFFVDIESVLAEKRAMLGCHRSQRTGSTRVRAWTPTSSRWRCWRKWRAVGPLPERRGVATTASRLLRPTPTRWPSRSTISSGADPGRPRRPAAWAGRNDAVTGLICREYRAEDGPGYLRIHDEAFPPVPDGYWPRWTQGSLTTASVAELDGEVVGAVPFVFRDLVVRPGVTVRVAWEYSVCVAARLRDRGVGTKLMTEAKRFLPGRCVAMMVYRNTERSAGYRYYARNGHHDLLYARAWKGTEAGAPAWPEGVQRVSWEEFLSDETRYRPLWAFAYATYGGSPARTPGFYAPAVDTPQYNEVPVTLTVLEMGETGYLIAGRERDASALHLMEIAAHDQDLAVMARLLAGFVALADETGAQPVAMTNDAAPVVPALRAAGFLPDGRGGDPMMIMAHLLDPEALARAVARTPPHPTGRHRLDAGREVILHRAAGPAAARHLEMKEMRWRSSVSAGSTCKPRSHRRL